jgi:hypothetical protein
MTLSTNLIALSALLVWEDTIRMRFTSACLLEAQVSRSEAFAALFGRALNGGC